MHCSNALDGVGQGVCVDASCPSRAQGLDVLYWMLSIRHGSLEFDYYLRRYEHETT